MSASPLGPTAGAPAPVEQHVPPQDAFTASLAAQIKQQRQELSDLKKSLHSNSGPIPITKLSGIGSGGLPQTPSPAASPLVSGGVVPPLASLASPSNTSIPISPAGGDGSPMMGGHSPIHSDLHVNGGSKAVEYCPPASGAYHRGLQGVGVSSVDIELRTQTQISRSNHPSPLAATGEWARVSLNLEDGGVVGYSVGGAGSGGVRKSMPTPFPTPHLTGAEQAIEFSATGHPQLSHQYTRMSRSELPAARSQLLAQHNSERFKQRLDGDKAQFEQRWGHQSFQSHQVTKRSRSVGAECRTKESAIQDWSAGSGAHGGAGSRPLVEHLLWERLRDSQDDAQRSRAALLVAENRLKEMSSQRAENQARMGELENEVRRKAEEDARTRRQEWEQERLRLLQRAEAAERETARQKETADHQLKRALRDAEVQQREYALQVLQESTSRLALVEQQERRRWADEIEVNKRVVEQLTERVRELETELNLSMSSGTAREEEERRNAQHTHRMLEELRAQLKEEEQQNAIRYERERAERAQALQRERESHAAEEQRLRASHATDLVRLQAAHESEVERERIVFRAQLERQREIHAAEQERMLEQYRVDRERDRAALEAQWQRERDGHAAAVEAAREEGREMCIREKQRFEEILTRERLDHSVEVQQIRGEHNAAIEAAKAMYSEEMERERAERAAETQRMAQQREDLFTVETMQVRAVREEAERRIAQFKEENQRERAQWELRISDLEARLEGAHQDREVALAEARLLSKRVDAMLSDKVEALYNAETCINNLTQSLAKERESRIELEQKLTVYQAKFVLDDVSEAGGEYAGYGGGDTMLQQVMIGRASLVHPIDGVSMPHNVDQSQHTFHLVGSRSDGSVPPIVHVEHVRHVPDNLSCDTIAADRANRCLQLAREYATKCAHAEDVRTRVSSRVEDIMSFVRSEQMQNQAAINARSAVSTTITRGPTGSAHHGHGHGPAPIMGYPLHASSSSPSTSPSHGMLTGGSGSSSPSRRELPDRLDRGVVLGEGERIIGGGAESPNKSPVLFIPPPSMLAGAPGQVGESESHFRASVLLAGGEDGRVGGVGDALGALAEAQQGVVDEVKEEVEHSDIDSVEEF